MKADADRRRPQSTRSRWLWDFLSGHSGSSEQMLAPVRQLAIEHLGLQGGERVLDLGCGTGPNFETLRQAIGPEGRVVGVDFSARMVQRSQQRVREHGWDNVEVICADAARVRLEPEAYDAAIATFTLSAVADVVAAVDTVYAALRPGGRFFACDLRLVPSGRVGLLIRLLGLAYRLIAGWSGRDVLEQLQARFQSVDLVMPLRPWPPVMLALASKAETGDAPARGQGA
ncbi:MAG: class I SAM-dependent methyltransferase [Chloroflexota bacterium]|nr:class I SAM-dependent methyltransferase [Chloroflexota bacterium]